MLSGRIVDLIDLSKSWMSSWESLFFCFHWPCQREAERKDQFRKKNQFCRKEIMRITNRNGKLQPNIWERFLSGHNTAENIFTKKHLQH